MTELPAESVVEESDLARAQGPDVPEGTPIVPGDLHEHFPVDVHAGVLDVSGLTVVR